MILVAVLTMLFIVLASASVAPPSAVGAASFTGDGFSGEGAMGDLRALAEGIGPRPYGSAGQDEAAQYILDSLRRAGAEAWLDPFRGFIAADSGGLHDRLFTQGENVVGRLDGEEDAALMVVAHYDTTTVSNPGADDNTSGVATMLELARVLGRQRLKHTVYFAAVDQEERGLIGSRSLAQRLGEGALPARSNLLAVVVLDMTAFGDRVVVSSGLPASPPTLVREAMAAGRGVGVRVVADLQPGSDHTTFLGYGIPAIRLGDDNPRVNTPWDTPSTVSVEALDRSGRVLQELVERLDRLPDERLAAMRDEARPDDLVIAHWGWYVLVPKAVVDPLLTVSLAAAAGLIILAVWRGARRARKAPPENADRPATARPAWAALSLTVLIVLVATTFGRLPARVIAGSASSAAAADHPWLWTATWWAGVFLLVFLGARALDAVSRRGKAAPRRFPDSGEPFWAAAVVIPLAFWALLTRLVSGHISSYLGIPVSLAAWIILIVLAYVVRRRPWAGAALLAAGPVVSYVAEAAFRMPFIGAFPPLIVLYLVFAALAIHRPPAGRWPSAVRLIADARLPRLRLPWLETSLATLVIGLAAAVALVPAAPPPFGYARATEYHLFPEGQAALVLLAPQSLTGQVTAKRDARAVAPPQGQPAVDWPETVTLVAPRYTGRLPTVDLSAITAVARVSKAVETEGDQSTREVTIVVEAGEAPRAVALMVGGREPFGLTVSSDPWSLEGSGPDEVRPQPLTPPPGPLAGALGRPYEFTTSDRAALPYAVTRTYLMPPGDRMEWRVRVTGPASASFDIYIDLLFDGFMTAPYDLEAPGARFDRETWVTFRDII